MGLKAAFARVAAGQPLDREGQLALIEPLLKVADRIEGGSTGSGDLDAVVHDVYLPVLHPLAKHAPPSHLERALDGLAAHLRCGRVIRDPTDEASLLFVPHEDAPTGLTYFMQKVLAGLNRRATDQRPQRDD
jgi:hypothetical protein